MLISELDYDLPEELIAQKPLPERDASRLLGVDVGSRTIDHHTMLELPELLPPSLLVFNDTRVFPARLHGHKPTGGKVELLLLHEVAGAPCHWIALGRASKPLREGTTLSLCDNELRARIVSVRGEGELEVELDADGSIHDIIERTGSIPLPPYIRRDPDADDRARYQTVFANKPGAVAAPTAGLHFTERLIASLEARGHRTAFVTLHVGPGTFRPVQVESLTDHPMHEETYGVPEETAAAFAEARREGRSVVAIGTTVVRTLEAAIQSDGTLQTGWRSTRLLIRPPYRFAAVDHLVTNFHLPRSTLIALVMALGGVDLIREAYRQAIAARYRFYSYGDAMLIRGNGR